MSEFLIEEGILVRYVGSDRDVTVPDGVTVIGDYVFIGCEGLVSVTLPEGVTKIGSGAFAYCGELASVTIPDSVTVIGGVAFAGCAGLASVHIPDGVTEFGEKIFLRCEKLTVCCPRGSRAEKYCKEDGIKISRPAGAQRG